MENSVLLPIPSDKNFESLQAVVTFFETMSDPNVDGEFIGYHIDQTIDFLTRFTIEMSNAADSKK